MKILLLISSFNSLSQKVFVRLKDRGHTLRIKFALNEKLMIKEVEDFCPDIILCPFLKQFVPKEIYLNTPTFILHPGVIGDRGHNSLDLAILKEKKEWGVVVLKANEEYDGGDIYSSKTFLMPNKNKASIYRNEVTNVALEAIDELLLNLQKDDFKPINQILNPIHEKITQKDREINWQRDLTKDIIKKIHASDSYPGVKDNILGLDCYLYGVCEEKSLKGKAKEILAKREGSICIATLDSAIWISHLKTKEGFKLPATYVLKDKLKGIKEQRIPLVLEEKKETFYELRVDKKNEIAYLYFDFHNGAMDSSQCIRLKYAIEHLKEECKVLVLMGGDDFFSNGIHLNILEDSKKQGEDGWSNINAINDVVKSILFAEDIITVASFSKNAGAGGVFLGLACDYVLMGEDSVLNPHYKTLGLSGSEYHTFSLPKRVGLEKSQEITNKCLPIGSKEALEIKMIDKVLKRRTYQKELEIFCESLIEDIDKFYDFIDDKKDFLYEKDFYIEECKEKELRVMYDEFWRDDSSFHKLREEFVKKITPKNTPKRLKEIDNA